jgi:hypothetical protein
MEKILKEFNWVKISSAISNKQDDIWVKDNFALVHGEGCYKFYIENLVDNKFLNIDDKRRVTTSYDLDDLKSVLREIDIKIYGVISETRNDKLKKLGI